MWAIATCFMISSDVCCCEHGDETHSSIEVARYFVQFRGFRKNSTPQNKPFPWPSDCVLNSGMPTANSLANLVTYRHLILGRRWYAELPLPSYCKTFCSWEVNTCCERDTKYWPPDNLLPAHWRQCFSNLDAGLFNSSHVCVELIWRIIGNKTQVIKMLYLV
jgi:hypothetical protein